MDRKSPSNYAPEGKNYIYVIVNQFNIYFVSVPNHAKIFFNAPHSAVLEKTLFFNPPHYLIGDRVAEYLKSEIAICCTLISIT